MPQQERTSWSTSFPAEADVGRSSRCGLGRPCRSCPGRRRRRGARDQSLFRRAPRNGPWGPRPHLERLRADLHAGPSSRPPARSPTSRKRSTARRDFAGSRPRPAAWPLRRSASGPPPRARQSKKAATVHDDAPAQISWESRCRSPYATGKGTDGIPAKHARIIRGLISVRDAVREVLRPGRGQAWGSAQFDCGLAYANFVRNFGPINLTTISETVNAEGETRRTSAAPLQPFLDDLDVWLVALIEDYDLESGTAKHGRSSGSACCIRKPRR